MDFICSPNDSELRLVIEDKWETFANGQVIVHFTVKNIGDAQARSSTACKYIGGIEVDTVSIPTLGAGTSCTRAFDPEPCPPGMTITVTVCADNYDVVDESNEDNNCMTNTFACPVGPQPGGPDLVVEKTVNVVGDTFVVDYTVTNIGNEIAGASRTTKYVDGVSVETQHCQRLGPGASYSDTFGPEPCPCGQILNVTICADNYHVVVESDETNNCEINEVICRPAVPEIEVIKTVWDGTAWVDEIDADVGDVVTLSSTIHNSGFCCNLTNIQVRDVLSPSLAYIDVVGATPVPDAVVLLPDGSTELRWFLPGLVLEPCNSETFLIRVRVVDCGVNINTQYARARADCTGEAVEGEDSAIVNGVGIPSIEVIKTVLDPDNGDWVNWITVSRDDTVKFNSTIHNDGICYNLTDIYVRGYLPEWCLGYVGVQGNTPPPTVTHGIWMNVPGIGWGFFTSIIPTSSPPFAISPTTYKTS